MLEREVAVKLLAEHLADDSQFISRFKREALSAAKLVHPNIVQVFDFGFDEACGRHYIVMEYIRGRSGAEILREETRLGVEDTLELVDGAAAASRTRIAWASSTATSSPATSCAPTTAP